MSDITVVVTESGGNTVSLNVGPAVNLGMPALLVQAGANITVTTSSGSFTISGPIRRFKPCSLCRAGRGPC
jgi:hypothetical protein